ncbi:MAG: hypothetical protein AAB110_07205, partial [Candidatus Desantisbacteria bacterium]
LIYIEINKKLFPFLNPIFNIFSLAIILLIISYLCLIYKGNLARGTENKAEDREESSSLFPSPQR